MNSCVFPGSFDPPTVGHMDLIRRAASIFDRVTVTVMINVRKKNVIPAETRIRILRKACAEFSNVRVERWDGLLADYMKEKRERIVLRGVRSVSEYMQEYDQAQINRTIWNGMETMLIFSDPALSSVSSSAVRELASFGGDISTYIPAAVREEIKYALSNKQV